VRAGLQQIALAEMVIVAVTGILGASSGRPGRKADPHLIGTSTRHPWKARSMRITRRIVVLDAADLDAESTFWARLLGGRVEAEDDWHSLYLDGAPYMGFQLAPDHVPPQWPGGTQQQQIHLDIYIADVQEAHEEVVALGARLLQAADDTGASQGFQVYADPAGHPFCLCWG
jgi:catechol 2,3-dioxygenase-like lactoylglutathione lyase family enzyme